MRRITNFEDEFNYWNFYTSVRALEIYCDGMCVACIIEDGHVVALGVDVEE